MHFITFTGLHSRPRARPKAKRSAWSALHREDEDRAIAHALSILASRLRQPDHVLSNTQTMKDFLRLQAHELPHEVFAVAFLDVRHRLIAYERMFRGSLGTVAVHPREVARQALLHNAAAVVLHHNHPGGSCEPSFADLTLTYSLRSALALLEVHVLDHIITSDDAALSMTEAGFLVESRRAT